MIPYEGCGKLEAGKDLAQYYDGTNFAEFLNNEYIDLITKEVYPRLFVGVLGYPGAVQQYLIVARH
ncbi:MAG: hypothetical protein LBB34_02665 [Holosporales bacterium]|jgi:hypothetical protein|nr:hypothetical protein [Holosporales bacterium]